MANMANNHEATNEETTMQVRVILNARIGGRLYFYYPGVTAKRAAELAAMECSAQCIDVDHFEVIDDCYGYDEPGALSTRSLGMILFADWQGHPIDAINGTNQTPGD